MITVILCARNGGKYIKEQICSIMDQSEQSFRLLVSDDDSSDNTIDEIRACIKAYPGMITLIKRSRPSGGAAKHFLQTLIQYGMNCDYCMLSDQDDVWKPNKMTLTLEKMEELEKKYGKDTPVLVHCDSEVTNEDLRVIDKSYMHYQKMSPQRNEFSQLLVQNNVTGGALMINHALLARLKSIPKYPVMHDHWLALMASAFGQIGYVKKSLYYYRQHNDNELGAAKGSRLKEITDRLGLFRKDKKTLKDMNSYSGKVYDNIFKQAENFNAFYGQDLEPKESRILLAFLRMQKANRFTKIVTILRYNITFNKFHRTIGECLFI